MQSLLSQGGFGFFPLGIFVIIALATILFVVWIVGIVRIVSGSWQGAAVHSLVVWCIGILGCLYLLIFVACKIVSSITGGGDYVFLLGCLALLPAAFIEKHKPPWGAVYLAAIATAVGFAHQGSHRLPSSYIALLICVWLLIPVWTASLAIVASRAHWRTSRFRVWQLLLLAAGVAFVFGSSWRIIRIAASF